MPAQHRTQQARPCTAGQGLLPLARPFEPGAPRLPLHLGFSCFKDKDFMTWKEVSAQRLALQGHLLPAVLGTFCLCSLLGASGLFLILIALPAT